MEELLNFVIRTKKVDMTPMRLEGDEDEDGEGDNDEEDHDEDDESTPVPRSKRRATACVLPVHL
jgi:hypothetical protein